MKAKEKERRPTAYRGARVLVHSPRDGGSTLCGIDVSRASVSSDNGDVSCKRCAKSLVRELEWQLWLTKGIQ